ncbi:hypothetical protein AVEN_12920-1 [Araneus ventricosus]|uniref:Uncharacterized protein n=1 Tax=Araneus ventricosus TaxID=182803 RepID=A0A4Y2IW45_ARAVE|nr:hypothetical protein AVEN_12920-1 [Araneus ventricosus]
MLIISQQRGPPSINSPSSYVPSWCAASSCPSAFPPSLDSPMSALFLRTTADPPRGCHAGCQSSRHRPPFSSFASLLSLPFRKVPAEQKRIVSHICLRFEHRTCLIDGSKGRT